MKHIHLLTLLLVCHAGVTQAQTEHLTVGLINVDRPPYFWQANETQPVRGLYPDLLHAISKETGIQFEYRFLPQARIRHYMKHQRLDVEPGIDISWRQEPEEAEATVYSAPFMESGELYVYNAEHITKIPTTKEQQTLEYCKILGFNDADSDKLNKTKQEVSSEYQILKMLGRKRCDYALFPKQVIDFFAPQLSFKLRLSEPQHRYSLRLRLNKQHERLLPQINAAINKFKLNGQLEKIIGHYTNMREKN